MDSLGTRSMGHRMVINGSARRRDELAEGDLERDGLGQDQLSLV